MESQLKKRVIKYIVNFLYAFRVRKPILIFRLITTFLNILLLKKQPLRYVDFAIGYRCNLICDHCFATALEDKTNTRKTLSPKEYGRIVKQAMDLGAVNFSFQGGEPVLYKSLVDFIKNSFPERNIISLTTNGTLLDEKKLKELKKIGVDILSISLDSANPAEHDAFRGVPGTFEKTIQTIKLGKKLGFNITIGAVASHLNIKSKGLVDLIELAHELNVVIFLALAAPLGNWGENIDVILTIDDKKHLQHLLKKYPLLRTDFEANYVHYGCGAVKEILYLTAYGDVLACPFLHFSLGNVFDETLKQIYDRALKIVFFKQYYPTCLAAEDIEFIKKYNSGPFYVKGRSGFKVKSFYDIHNL